MCKDRRYYNGSYHIPNKHQQKDAIQMVLKDWAKVYNNPEFIKSDPIQFPKSTWVNEPK